MRCRQNDASCRRKNLRTGLLNHRPFVTVRRFDALDLGEVDNPHAGRGRHRKGGEQNRQHPDDSSPSHLESSISGTAALQPATPGSNDRFRHLAALASHPEFGRSGGTDAFFVRDGIFYWADSCLWTTESATENTWVAARKVSWRDASDWLGPGLRYRGPR